ncbi:MAG: hypothetical protein EOO87_21940 [Pedobacter sp.]|nr:MAG: hypothetical protein EOO87_21940 [Pedobacter sp.]
MNIIEVDFGRLPKNSILENLTQCNLSITRLFIFGILALAFATYILFTNLLFPENALSKFNGKLEISDVSIEDIKIKSRYSREYISKRAILRFRLTGNNQKFELWQPIELIHNNDNSMEKINLLLKSADEITVWIKESEIGEDVSRVYKLDVDRFNAYNEDQEPNKSFTMFFILLLTSIAFFILHFALPQAKSTF